MKPFKKEITYLIENAKTLLIIDEIYRDIMYYLFQKS